MPHHYKTEYPTRVPRARIADDFHLESRVILDAHIILLRYSRTTTKESERDRVIIIIIMTCEIHRTEPNVISGVGLTVIGSGGERIT